MFSTLMVNTWLAATIVAIVAGTIGFFAVLRRSAFAAHALPQGAFAGAACASLLGLSTILGLAVFSILGAISIALLGRRGRHDAVTALTLVLMLGLGALFLSFSVEYAPEIYSLLFGEILGVSRSDLLPITALGAASVLATVALYRPLLLSSVISDAAEARGVNTRRLELCFLLVMALAISATVPVVGTFLVFSLMIAPAGSARTIATSPLAALALSILIALATVWPRSPPPTKPTGRSASTSARSVPPPTSSPAHTKPGEHEASNNSPSPTTERHPLSRREVASDSP